MAGVAFVVKVSEADRTLLGDGLAEEVRQRIGRPALNVTVSYEPDIAGGGVIVEDAEAARCGITVFSGGWRECGPNSGGKLPYRLPLSPETESGGNRQ